MRNYLDPKRFYKNPDKLGTILHVGTVIEGSAEYKSNRLTRKERKQSILEELMSDNSIKNYTKNKYEAIQQKNMKKRNKNSKSKSFKSNRKNGFGYRK